MLKDNLKKLRKEKGLSQYAVAEKLGFSRGKYANYEQGSREPDLATVEKIAEFFDVSVDYLLGRSDTDQLTESEKNFVRDSKELTVKELQNEYNLTIDGRKATPEEIEGAIAFIRSVRQLRD